MKPHLIEKEKCTGCGACEASCQYEAIEMKLDKNGYLCPVIHTDKCVGCGLCEKRCPMLNKKKLDFHPAKGIRNYAAWSNDDEVCKRASSGGIFSQLALDILRKGNGVCYGATFTEDNKCFHIGVERAEDLHLIVGTKYIQSDASKCYPDVKKSIKANKDVLFCGTPCQIAGLYAYLGGYKDSPNLLTAELICHGMGSSYALDLALKYYHADRIISFRDKKEGWVRKNLDRVSQKNTFHIYGKGEYRPERSLYWSLFCNTHRDCCFKCAFAQINRVADLSLGDLWGKYAEYPERWDLGVSLVLSNTEKGHSAMASTTMTVHQNENKELNCWTLFYPGASSAGQLGHWMWLIRRFPAKFACSILSLDKRNPLIWPIKLFARNTHRKHVEKTLQAMETTKRGLGWL